jgi:hypothetical protein
MRRAADQVAAWGVLVTKATVVAGAAGALVVKVTSTQ